MVQSNSDKEHPNDVVSSHSLSTKRITETLTSSSSVLPFDLIADILCRLPVKLLLQLRCLCKSFNSLISDPKFAKKHLHFSIKRHHLIVSSTNNLQEVILFDFPIPSVFETFSRVSQIQLNYPDCLDNQKGQPFAVCSCDGIFCITTFNSSALLWNPSIRKFNILPPFETSPKILPISLYSFGYDHFIDNYKVIVISTCINKNEVSVHTLGTDYWRRIDDFPYSRAIRGLGIFVSGTVNWLAVDDSIPNCMSPVIVSLDLEKESYQKLPQPDLEEKYQWTLGSSRDCLCIFVYRDMFLDVWMMKEYGIKGSWTKLYTVPYIGDREIYPYAKPLYVSEDDQMLMEVGDLINNKVSLVVYDSKNGTSKISEIQNLNFWMHPEVYFESLISPCS